MTGYGCGQSQTGEWVARAEIRCLNHRFLDICLRFPRYCLAIEERARELISGRVSRGRVEVFLSLEVAEGVDRPVKVDMALAQSYHNALNRLSESLGLAKPGDVTWLAQLPGVLQAEERLAEGENLWAAVRPALEQALAGVEEMRRLEGARLGTDLGARVERVRSLLEEIRQVAPAAEVAYQDKLRARLAELAQHLDTGRLAAEAALFAEKVSIHEEVVRLEAHLQELIRLLGASGPVGRRLDFLLQEAFREANTMAAKAQDATVSQLVVEIKAELEKMREQGQNVE